MSAIGDKDLVRVRSRDELRAGMTVVIRPCGIHPGRTCAAVVLGKFSDDRPHSTRGGGEEPCAWPWSLRTTHTGRSGCFCTAIAEGRLYRLRDLDDSKTDSVAARRPMVTPVKT